ncbi:MAG: DUF86 domain-containing protein [Ectothiorhodospiraceae bacterium]
MTDTRVKDTIAHITAAIDLALGYVDGMGRDGFMEDRRTQQAVIFNLIIIGEAAARLLQHAPQFTADNPHIPWRSMRGMRNRITHGYFTIDLDIVWNTMQTALPELRNKVSAVEPPP